MSARTLVSCACLAAVAAAAPAAGQKPAIGLHVAGPTQASLAVGVWLGPDPRKDDVGGVIALVEPGLRGGRASLGYAYALRGNMGSFVTGRATALRTWRTRGGPRSYVGAELQVLPILAVGPRLGAFVPTDRGAKRLLWVLDFGAGL